LFISQIATTFRDVPRQAGDPDGTQSRNIIGYHHHHHHRHTLCFGTHLGITLKK